MTRTTNASAMFFFTTYTVLVWFAFKWKTFSQVDATRLFCMLMVIWILFACLEESIMSAFLLDVIDSLTFIIADIYTLCGNELRMKLSLFHLLSAVFLYYSVLEALLGNGLAYMTLRFLFQAEGNLVLQLLVLICLRLGHNIVIQPTLSRFIVSSLQNIKTN